MKSYTKKESNTINKDMLIVVKGDNLSNRLLHAAKRFKFKGLILRLTPKEAEHQHIPLPRLSIYGNSYGPEVLYALTFRNLSQFKVLLKSEQ